MTPQERRQLIIDRIEAGGFTKDAVRIESDYPGLRHYLTGTDASDVNIYKVELALDRLEKGKK